MKNYFTLFLGFLLLISNSYAQHDFCGYEHKEKPTTKNLKTTRVPDDGSWIDIPVKFYVETNSSGTPLTTDERIDISIERANKYYEKGKVRFFKCGPTIIDTMDIPINYDIPLVSIKNDLHACGVASGNKVDIKGDCIAGSTFGRLLAHELGHAFGLLHTFGKYYLQRTKELVDGSNCATEGDEICDTPADPNSNAISDCIYVGSLTDANGDVYNPSTENIMSYYFSCSSVTNGLTEGQLDRVRQHALSNNFACGPTCITPGPTASGVEICRNGVASLSATSSSPEIRWYDVKTGGTPVATGPSFTTPALSETRYYYVEAVDGCASLRTEVKVTVNPPRGPGFEAVSQLPDENGNTILSPRSFVTLGNTLYFFANDDEVWKVEQGAANAQMVKSLGFGAFLFEPAVVSLGDKFVTFVNSLTGKPSVWVSDGTSSGTGRIDPFLNDYNYSYFDAFELNGEVYFVVNDPERMGELWKTDGSEAGTQIVTQLNNNSFTHTNFTRLGDEFMFTSQNAATGDTELWKTDGTAEGTVFIHDVQLASSLSRSNSIAAAMGGVYFAGDDGVHGMELWVTDGTPLGTQLVQDINPSGSSNVENLVEIEGKLFFSADDGTNGRELYTSNGTSEGTFMVRDIHAGGSSDPYNFFVFDNRWYFLADDGIHGTEIWRFSSNDLHDVELFKNIHQTAGIRFNEQIEYKGVLYMSVNDGDGFGDVLYRTDGTKEGTYMQSDLSASAGPYNFKIFDNRLFFAAFKSGLGNELWVVEDQDLHVCPGATITINTTNPQGTITWYDSEDGGNVLGSGGSFTTGPISTDTLFYADLIVDGCTSARLPVLVETGPKPPVVTGDTIEEGLSASLNAASENGTIHWYQGPSGSAPLFVGSNYVTSALSTNTVFYASAVDEECQSEYVAVPVIVLNYFNLTVTNGSGSGSYLEGSDVQISADAPSEGMSFVSWKGDNEYITDTTEAVTVITMPTQDISVEAGYSVINFLSSLNDEELNVYPNPATDMLFIESKSGIISYQVTDSKGKVLLEASSSNDKRSAVNIEEYQPGVYLLRIEENNRINTLQFVIY